MDIDFHDMEINVQTGPAINIKNTRVANLDNISARNPLKETPVIVVEDLRDCMLRDSRAVENTDIFLEKRGPGNQIQMIDNDFSRAVRAVIEVNTGHEGKEYRAAPVKGTKIKVDGILDEEAWMKAVPETGFIFPWEDRAVPETEFRACHDKENFYFAFEIRDDELVCHDNVNSEEDLISEDRAEMYFTRDDELGQYYCFEIDAKGRILDYSASYYRKFDFSWDWPGLVAAAKITQQGYTVEGMIPISSFKSLHLLDESGGNVFKTGIFRAEFNRKPDGSIEEHWLSWIDPRVSEPDYHVPTSFGSLFLE
jgi:hypothetical protein